MMNSSLSTDCIIEMERAALQRWGNGDPSGFLEITAEEIVYFDPYVKKRVDGKKALTDLYESIRGQIHVDSFELINPHINSCDNMAVLTFNYVSITEGKEDRWNCTEVYKLNMDKWEIIQTHWSLTAQSE